MAKRMCSVNGWTVYVLLVLACVSLDSGASALPAGADRIAAGTGVPATDDGTTETDTTQAGDQRETRQGKNMRGSMVVDNDDQGSGSGQLPDADALRENLRASWPEFKPTTAARKFKSWRDVNKQLQPVLQTKDGTIRCWSDDDPRRLPRYQAFCFLERMCYLPNRNGKKQWYIPLPDYEEAGVDLSPLTRQRHIPTGPLDRVQSFKQSREVVYVHGARTPHFPEWIDGPMFLFGYQMHAWEFGLPRATIMFDHRSKDKVMSWVNGVNRMLQVAAGLKEVHSQNKPLQRDTCYRGVISFTAHLEADSFFTRRAKHNKLEYKYEASPRRHFFYPADAAIWHYTAVQYAHKKLHRRHCCENEQEYQELGQIAWDHLLSTYEHEAPGTFNSTLLQRGRGNGRRFYQVDKIQQCLVDKPAELLGLRPEMAQSRVVSWEGASLEDQILQTAASTLFMASHGAGGINYIWLKPCSVFVDAFPFNHFSPHFYGFPAENMGLVYGYTNFVPPTKHMAKCLPEAVKKPGQSYQCMKMLPPKCRKCVRSQSYLVVPCKQLGVVLEYALLRRQQCLNELAFGLRPESRHGNMYLSHGGRSMEFEREEEVFDEKRLKALISRAKDAGHHRAVMYQAVPPVVVPQQLLETLEQGHHPNSVHLVRPDVRARLEGNQPRDIDDDE